MRRSFPIVMRRAAAASAISSMLAAAVTVPAAAAGLASTYISWTSRPSAVTYADRHTVISGVLRTQGASSPQGVASEPIHLVLLGPDGRTTAADLGTVTTGQDGSFTLAVTVPQPGIVMAYFAGDATYRESQGSTAVAPAQRYPSRVVLDPMPATVNPGVPFPITGQVQEQLPDGTWVPAVGVGVAFEATLNPIQYTGNDGRFSVTAEESAPRWWMVLALNNRLNFAQASQSNETLVGVPPEQTRITSFNISSNGTAQQGVTITVHADILVGGQWKPYGGQLDVAIQRKGATTWQTWWRGIQGAFNTQGDQVISAGEAPADWIAPASSNSLWSKVTANGLLQASVEAVPSSVGVAPVLASTSASILTVPQQYATALYGPWLVAKGHWRGLQADLFEPCGGSSSPGYCGMAPHQTVKLYFRYRGSKTWHYATTTTTDGNGQLTVKLTGTRRWYRLVYSGTPQFAPTVSQAIYFSS